MTLELNGQAAVPQRASRGLVLFVGRVGEPAWREELQWLRTCTEVVCCARCEAAENWLRDTGRSPTIVVLAESHRGVFEAAAVHSLLEQAPLARSLVVQGSLCEGESRSGSPYEGVERAYWYQFKARVAGLLESANLARTGTPQERVMESAERELPSGEGLVGIVSDSLLVYEGLEQGCRLAGYRPTWLRPGGVTDVGGLRAVIVDGGALDKTMEMIEQLPPSVRAAPRVILANFPRLQDVETASAEGRAVVVAKPYRLHELLWQLADLVQRAQRDQAA